MTFADPKIDFAFKKIFGDQAKKHILISFLNAVLEKGIVDIQILDPYQAPKLKNLKYTILDVKATDAHGNHFIVEMQANPYAFFDKRALDYLSRTYAGQLQKGDDYSKHRPVYFIGILGFTFFQSTKYLSKHLILNAETNTQEIRDFELYFIELPKFKKKLPELTGILDQWTYFIKHAGKWNQVPPELDRVPEIHDAADTANYATWTQDEIEIYEYWEREENTNLATLRDLENARKEIEEKDAELQEVRKAQLESDAKQTEMLRQFARTLAGLGKTEEEIANTLSISLEDVRKYL